MLMVEIALGIVLGVLILRFLPAILSLAVGVATIVFFVGLLVVGVALFIDSPKAQMIVGMLASTIFFLYIGIVAHDYIGKHYEAFPAWLKRAIQVTKGIHWALLLFSALLAIFVWSGLAIAIYWTIGPSLTMDPTGWTATGLSITTGLLYPVLTALIYRLPWQVKTKRGFGS